MNKLTFIFITLFHLSSCNEKVAEKVSEEPPSKAKQLIIEMTEACGGKDSFLAKKDVQYVYTYSKPWLNQKDVSLEKYLFDQERSVGVYTTYTKGIFDDPSKGHVTQIFHGKKTIVKVGDSILTEGPFVDRAHFLRKTNYYWFAMMFKLLDDGTNYEYKGSKEVNGVNYELVEINYGENVGEVNDTYLLYINPETKLVDQFLFTVMAFDRVEPLLMKVKYAEVEGLQLPTHREYARADWEGNVLDTNWTQEICTEVRFGNGFSATDFSID